MEPQHRGIRDLGYMGLFRRNFSTPTFGPRQLCKCAKVNYPVNKLYIISAIYIEIAKPKAYPLAAFVPIGNGQVCALARPAAVK